MLSPVAAGHRASIALVIEWLLIVAVALTGALMVVIGMIEELPIIVRSTLNRLFRKEPT